MLYVWWCGVWICVDFVVCVMRFVLLALLYGTGISVFICVYVCVWERKTEREREK